MALPKHTEELCFATDAFLDEDFSVDDFVNKCRKRVTIECLRDDLDAYYRTLKSAMVELINKDYADFVNLSSNLVGVDKSIGSLAAPLEELRDEIQGISVTMDEAISSLQGKLSARTDVRNKKVTLRRLMAVMEAVDSLEKLLKVKSSSSTKEELSEIEQLAEREEFAAVVMERVASEFNQLQYNVSLTRDHPLIADITPRIAAITSSLQARLEHSFQVALDKGDEEGLTHTLQAYASISRQEDAESMFRSAVVQPYLEKVISLKAVQTGSGLTGVYSKVLMLLPQQCSLLVGLTHRRPRGLTPRVPGFDFLVNGVWPEVVALIDERLSIIFAPGNPDNFYKNYTTTMEFLSSLEEQCPSRTSVKRLRAHPSFTAFLSKWSLPVYFQIRFQEIGGALENALRLSPAQDSPPSSGPAFRLELFCVLWCSLHRCWADGVFIPALVHWFWKLTVQLILRTYNWLRGLTTLDLTPGGDTKTTSTASSSCQEQSPLAVQESLQVIHDCELFAQQVPQFYALKVNPRLPLKAVKDPSSLQGSMVEVSGEIESLVPQFSSHITSQVSLSCIQNLEPAHTVPRLYRRTNREAPQKVSSYVANILKPLLALQRDIPAQYLGKWSNVIIQRVTERYYEITSEVLTSVKRTEDSLLKLRRNRQSLVPTGGMSDDNKIRLQLALDIEEYSSQAEKTFHVRASDMPSMGRLLEMGRAAKTLAQTAPSEQVS